MENIYKGEGVLVNGVLYNKDDFREFILDIVDNYKNNKNNKKKENK